MHPFCLSARRPHPQSVRTCSLHRPHPHSMHIYAGLHHCAAPLRPLERPCARVPPGHGCGAAPQPHAQRDFKDTRLPLRHHQGRCGSGGIITIRAITLVRWRQQWPLQKSQLSFSCGGGSGNGAPAVGLFQHGSPPLIPAAPPGGKLWNDSVPVSITFVLLQLNMR